jgi:hypothetical protein
VSEVDKYINSDLLRLKRKPHRSLITTSSGLRTLEEGYVTCEVWIIKKEPTKSDWDFSYIVGSGANIFLSLKTQAYTRWLPQ